MILALSILSCGKDKPVPVKNYIQLELQPTFGALPFYMDSIYTSPQGYKVKFTELKCYFSLLGNGTTSLQQACLFDYRETGSLLLKQEADYSKFASLQFKLGVDSSLNHLDPSAFPNDSPLNISNAGPMHWGWNPGYIFMNLEGKVDTLIDGLTNPDLSFSFHIGTDAYLQALTFSGLNWQDVGANTRRCKLKIDLEAFLANPAQSIDLKNEHLTHTAAGQEALTAKVIQNFKAAISLY
ncbi:MAG: hypothetical protein RLZZ301_356 [Bacteroidota bacterium]